jgi:hypothetical protein
MEDIYHVRDFDEFKIKLQSLGFKFDENNSCKIGPIGIDFEGEYVTPEFVDDVKLLYGVSIFKNPAEFDTDMMAFVARKKNFNYSGLYKMAVNFLNIYNNIKNDRQGSK